MRRLLPLLALAAAAACSTRGQPILLNDDDRRSYRYENADEEQRAKDAIADIEKRIERGELPKIEFDFDMDEITPESEPTLMLVADLLIANPRLKVFVLAHTDSIGTEEYNLDLSERRAKSVKSNLVQKGVAPPSIRFKGLGFSRPIADNSTDWGRAKNRRVEFRVTYREWEAVY